MSLHIISTNWRVISAFLLVFLLLAACMPANIPSNLQPAPPALLPLAEYDAAQTVGAAQTQQANIARQVVAATAEAQATQAAYSFSTTATAGALALLQTQSAATSTASAGQFQSTQTAQAQAYALSATESSGRATQVALDLAITKTVSDARRAEDIAGFWSTLIPLTTLTVLVGLIIFVFWMAKRLFISWLEWMDQRQSVMETRSGTVVWIVDEEGNLLPQLLDGTKLLNSSFKEPPTTSAYIVSTKAETLTPSGSVWAYPLHQSQETNPERTARSLAKLLIWQALETAGPRARHIPSWRHLSGWTSDRWQKAAAVLKNAGIIETDPRRGTYLTRYECLSDLWNALEAKQVSLSPTPNSGRRAP